MRGKKSGKIMPAPKLGARLTAGLQTLNLYIEVRILCPQPKRSERGVFCFKKFNKILIMIMCGRKIKPHI